MDIHPTAEIAVTALIDRTWPKGVHIGPFCKIADHAVLLTHDFTRGLYLDTWIGARTFIGARSIIMPGVRVGDDCVIMPGALVSHDVPDASVAIGNPARVEPKGDVAS